MILTVKTISGDGYEYGFVDCYNYTRDCKKLTCDGVKGLVGTVVCKEDSIVRWATDEDMKIYRAFCEKR